MQRKPAANVFFIIGGFCLLAVSLATGCSWNVEGENFRIRSGHDDTQTEGRFHHENP